MERILYIVGLLTLCVALPAFPQPLRFTQEKIRIEVREDSYRLDGSYVFENSGPAPVQRSLFYPMSPTSTPPESLVVEDPDSRKQIAFVQGEQGFSFSLTVSPYRSQELRVVFVQRAPRHRLEYILRSTREWGRPLERAKYSVHIPPSCKLLHLSLHPDKIVQDADGTLYSVLRENFMPRQNLIVKWGRSTP